MAELLKLNPQTVRNWIDAGDLAAVRVGRRVRVRQSELDRFIAAGETAPVRQDQDAGSADATAELRQHLRDAIADMTAALEGNDDRLASSLESLIEAAAASVRRSSSARRADREHAEVRWEKWQRPAIPTRSSG